MDFVIDEDFIEHYSKDDVILKLLKLYTYDSTTHKWLLGSLPKRAVYFYLYGDMFYTNRRYNILDIGGGCNGLTKILADKHNYTLIDIMAHDTCNIEYIDSDWYDVKPREYDIIIANDIFPNVDQRLEPFLELYESRYRDLRMSLTYNNKYYRVRREDGDEVFFMYSWTKDMLLQCLKKHYKRDFPNIANHNNHSLFANGRQICIITDGGL